jgi:hypothetical protein
MGARSRNNTDTSRLASVSVLVTVLVLVLVFAGCGASAKSSASKTIAAGQVDPDQSDLKLPPGWKMTDKGPVRTAAATAADKSAAPGASSATGDTVPLAKEDPTTKFFGALGIFQSCLKGLGVKFIGVPSATDPNSPANNPDYIKALSTCAAKSNIVQALKDQQAAQDNLTPKQIEDQNKGYLAWRDCMIGRGWGIPKPKPDAKGRLFSFGAGGGGSVPNFTPPPGQDILSSGDTQQCATEAQQKAGPSAGG